MKLIMFDILCTIAEYNKQNKEQSCKKLNRKIKNWIHFNFKTNNRIHLNNVNEILKDVKNRRLINIYLITLTLWKLNCFVGFLYVCVCVYNIINKWKKMKNNVFIYIFNSYWLEKKTKFISFEHFFKLIRRKKEKRIKLIM